MGLIQSTTSDNTNETTITYKFPFYKSEKTITYINTNKVIPDNLNINFENKEVNDEQLINMLKSMSFDSHRKTMLKDYLKYNKIDTKYMNDIAKTFTFDNEKVEVYNIMLNNLK
jgi:hypothetical protein